MTLQTVNTDLLALAASMILSVLLAAYLLRVWYRQEHRILTDLPLMFAITFVAQSTSLLILILPELGVVEMSLAVFKVRTLVICALVLPMLGVMLNIWLPRYERYHLRAMALFVVVWVVVTALADSETMIMTILIPLIIPVFIGILLTFLITWYTKRLREVRSDLMVASVLLAIANQATRVWLQENGLISISYLTMLLSMLLTTLALTNPWAPKRAPVVVPPTTLPEA